MDYSISTLGFFAGPSLNDTWISFYINHLTMTILRKDGVLGGENVKLCIPNIFTWGHIHRVQ